MRIFYHAINGVGLGHLMRLSAIAVAVRQNAPDVHQFIATSANYPPHFDRLNMPFIVLPGHDSGPFLKRDRRARSVSHQFAGRLLDHAITEYDPRMVVFDTHAPSGLVRKVVDDGRLAALVYRGCREEYTVQKLSDGFLSLFQLVLVPHTQAEFAADITPATQVRLNNLETVQYVGPIVFPDLNSAAERQAVWRKYGLKPSERLVLVTAGAGGLGKLNETYFQKICRAVLELRKRHAGLRVICVGGPYSGAVKVPEGCIYVASEPNLRALMTRAEVVVSVPGYNTVQEILETGARAILVPVQRYAQEDMFARVQALEQRGRVGSLTFDASGEDYTSGIENMLGAPKPEPEPAPGAALAAEAILQASCASRRFVCSRDAAISRPATRFRSTELLARAIAQEHGMPVTLRIDCELLQDLLPRLDEASLRSITGLEIVMGASGLEEAAVALREAHALLVASGIAPGNAVFSVDDPTGGQLFAELTSFVRDLPFQSLVARLPEKVLKNSPDLVFRNLEICRSFLPAFKIDVTVLGNQFAFIDQP